MRAIHKVSEVCRNGPAGRNQGQPTPLIRLFGVTWSELLFPSATGLTDFLRQSARARHLLLVENGTTDTVEQAFRRHAVGLLTAVRAGVRARAREGRIGRHRARAHCLCYAVGMSGALSGVAKE